MERIASTYTPLSNGEFAALGNERLAYVRSVRTDNGHGAIGVFAADGRQLAIVPSLEIAKVLIRQNDRDMALVH